MNTYLYINVYSLYIDMYIYIYKLLGDIVSYSASALNIFINDFIFNECVTCQVDT